MLTHYTRKRLEEERQAKNNQQEQPKKEQPQEEQLSFEFAEESTPQYGIYRRF